MKIEPSIVNVCRLRDTPIIGFVNKLDRDIRDAIELLDEIEDVLKIEAAPINWPIGMGKFFKGVYNLYTDTIHCFEQGNGQVLPPDTRIQGLIRMKRGRSSMMSTTIL